MIGFSKFQKISMLYEILFNDLVSGEPRAMNNPLTFIDLFCGCGGFSLGLERAGFKGLAAIDFNREAIEVFKANFSKIPHMLEKDLTKFPPSELESLIGTNHVDLIVGGPPCQGFSTARQVDGANHGERLKEDSR